MKRQIPERCRIAPEQGGAKRGQLFGNNLPPGLGNCRVTFSGKYGVNVDLPPPEAPVIRKFGIRFQLFAA